MKKNERLMAVIFGGVGIVFLIAVFFFKENTLTLPQNKILGAMAAFTFGTLAFLMTGSIGVDGEGTLPRFGKVTLRAAGGMAIFVTVLFWWIHSSEAIRAEYAEQVNEHSRPPLDDEPKKELPSEVAKKAHVLVDQGNKEQQALSQIALGKPLEADKLIQELKAGATDDLYRIYMLEGNNWQNAGESDQAIKPYQMALSLKENDFEACNALAAAYRNASSGDESKRFEEAIKVLRGALSKLPEGTEKWALTRKNLGVTISKAPGSTPDKVKNLESAIEHYSAALPVLTKKKNEIEWAKLQNNLGIAWRKLSTNNIADRAERIAKAIDYYEAALTVWNQKDTAENWARTQNNLAIAWRNKPPENDPEHVKKAIAHYELALQVRTKESFKEEHARTQHNLGMAWVSLRDTNVVANLRKAVECYEAALAIRKDRPGSEQLANTQSGYARALSLLVKEVKEPDSELSRRAIENWTSALTYYKTNKPAEYTNIVTSIEAHKEWEKTGNTIPPAAKTPL
jgi:tetratricopeptide (TPR) repeat protein